MSDFIKGDYARYTYHISKTSLHIYLYAKFKIIFAPRIDPRLINILLTTDKISNLTTYNKAYKL